MSLTSWSFPRKHPSFKFLEKQNTRFLVTLFSPWSFLHPSIDRWMSLFSARISFKNIYISLAMQRDLCVSCASLPVLGVHLCDRFAMMYDSRVSLSTRASGSFEFPSRWNKHLFPVSAVCYVTSRLKWYRNSLFSPQERKLVSFLRTPMYCTQWMNTVSDLTLYLTRSIIS